MLDEEINKRIREAANQYHPAYDDKAWERMEQLLDEHLPQKRDRRKIFFILSATVIVGTGLFFIFYPGKKSDLPPLASATVSSIPSKGDSQSPTPGVHGTVKNRDYKRQYGGASLTRKNDGPDQPTAFTPVFSAKNPNKPLLPYRHNLPKEGSASKVQTTEVTAGNASAGSSSPANGQPSSELPEKLNNNPVVNLPSARQPTANTIDSAAAKGSGTLDSKQRPESPGKQTFKSPASKTAVDKKFTANFGIDLSAGPDISGVHLSKTGKVTITYGAGLDYELSRRVMLRAGFYVAEKIYSVTRDQYHAQIGNVVNYAYLKNIGANCRVYEIPVIVSYSFGKVRSHRWFVATGLSTYLMNKESYVYDYKYPSGTTDEKYWSISNKNKSYFSVWDLSGGYQYLLNKKVAFTAEPYLKFPFSGIGAGAIKLNSGGILFTATVRPFNK